MIVRRQLVPNLANDRAFKPICHSTIFSLHRNLPGQNGCQILSLVFSCSRDRIRSPTEDSFDLNQLGLIDLLDLVLDVPRPAHFCGIFNVFCSSYLAFDLRGYTLGMGTHFCPCTDSHSCVSFAARQAWQCLLNLSTSFTQQPGNMMVQCSTEPTSEL